MIDYNQKALIYSLFDKIQPMEKLINKIKDFSQLVMFQHSVFALLFIFIAMVVLSAQVNGTPWFGFKLLVLWTLCAVFARNFAMGFNRFMDRDIDALNPRTKNRQNVDGRVSAKDMFIFFVANALAFILVAYFVNE